MSPHARRRAVRRLSIRHRKGHAKKPRAGGKKGKPIIYRYYGSTLTRYEIIENLRREGHKLGDIELALRVAEERAKKYGRHVITDMDIKNILDVELSEIRRSHPRKSSSKQNVPQI
ncbi:MAG: hypothetical protein J7L44_01545 [Candidatus Diapherotrites archaeon]|nr:hypothetical protein [Candidatus Diapherotrites archaeon]